MALPYPQEVETGQLKPRVPRPRAPFDIVQHLRDEIRTSGARVELFGAERDLAEGENAAPLVNRFRDTLAMHLQERRPDCDELTWDLFASQARALVEQSSVIDDDMLRVLLLTIDGL
jgi:hypothetical protein